MVRRFVTLDGEILATEEWTPTAHPENRCFWCDDHLIPASETLCSYNPFDIHHDWVTLCNRDFV